MRIPIPCKFGEKAECDNKMLEFYGVSWYFWDYRNRWDFTYFFSTGDIWHPTTFYVKEYIYSEIFENENYLII